MHDTHTAHAKMSFLQLCCRCNLQATEGFWVICIFATSNSKQPFVKTPDAASVASQTTFNNCSFLNKNALYGGISLDRISVIYIHHLQLWLPIQMWCDMGLKLNLFNLDIKWCWKENNWQTSLKSTPYSINMIDINQKWTMPFFIAVQNSSIGDLVTHWLTK